MAVSPASMWIKHAHSGGVAIRNDGLVNEAIASSIPRFSDAFYCGKMPLSDYSIPVSIRRRR